MLAQFSFVLSQTLFSIFRGRILHRISRDVNIQIASDFWIKLLKLPLPFFKLHDTGETIRRLADQRKIQDFCTGTLLETVFSVITFLIYSSMLIYYDIALFGIFCLGSVIYFFWLHFFQNIRRRNNYQSFSISARENSATLELVQGMHEIRLNNAERKKRWAWEKIQVLAAQLNFEKGKMDHIQISGTTFISQCQGIWMSYLVAVQVVNGQISIGSMFAIQYIIGQLTIPVSQWSHFFQSAQDAKISMERLNEIQELDEEEAETADLLTNLPVCKTIHIRHLSFGYQGSDKLVLKDISLIIPEKKVTAIVGSSGSGKTTIIKILLKVFEEYTGSICLGENSGTTGGQESMNLKQISARFWRGNCGCVLQDGFIFSDTILSNIALRDEEVDERQVVESCKIARIEEFIESLPNRYLTKIGEGGIGISQGQKQRILIARSIYNNPEYLFFDEATNSLDSGNEKAITENLKSFFAGRTVVIVAHRLSTVIEADNIVVLCDGEIVEEGSHQQLTKARGRYYELIKSQLEMET